MIDAAAEGNKSKIDSAQLLPLLPMTHIFMIKGSNIGHHIWMQMLFVAKNKQKLENIAFENSWFQAGFFDRSSSFTGLDCGPMMNLGFDKAKIA